MNKTYLFLFVLALSIQASAQITITAADLPGTGFSYGRYRSAFNIAVNPGAAGANQVWTISNNDWPYPGSSTIVQPSSTPFAGSFPTATSATQEADSDVAHGTVQLSYDYSRVAQDGLYELGYGTEGFDPTVWSPQPLELPLPLSYSHGAWTSVGRMTDASGTTVDSTIHTLDGWGTLNTPYGSTEVLRVFNQNWFIMRGSFDYMVATVSYSWINRQGIEVAWIVSPDDTTNPGFTHGGIRVVDLRTSGVDTDRRPVAWSFSLEQNYPNPFNPTTTISFSLPKASRVKVEVFDVAGRRTWAMQSAPTVMSAGEHSVVFDGSSLASGIYFARISADGLTQTVKMQLVK